MRSLLKIQSSDKSPFKHTKVEFQSGGRTKVGAVLVVSIAIYLFIHWKSSLPLHIPYWHVKPEWKTSNPAGAKNDIWIKNKVSIAVLNEQS
jgi:hypothetical protein